MTTPHYASHSIITRQPPANDDFRQRITQRLIAGFTNTNSSLDHFMTTRHDCIDPITLIEVAQLNMVKPFAIPGHAMAKHPILACFTILYYKFPQFFENEESLRDMKELIPQFPGTANIGLASGHHLRDHYKVCMSQMSTATGFSSVIGWNTTEAILFRNGRYVHHLMELYQQALKKSQVPA
jgi:hypothetical protein